MTACPRTEGKTLHNPYSSRSGIFWSGICLSPIGIFFTPFHRKYINTVVITASYETCVEKDLITSDVCRYIISAKYGYTAIDDKVFMTHTVIYVFIIPNSVLIH